MAEATTPPAAPPAGDSASAYKAQRIVGDPAAFKTDRPKLPEMPGFHIVGDCPVCSHRTSAVCATAFLAQEQIEDGEARSLRRDFRLTRRAIGRRRQANRKSQVTVLRCACTQNHAPPAGASPFGCGAEWLFRVDYGPRGADDGAISAVEEDFKYWPAADAAAAEIPTALSTAQASAKNWAPALTALLTVLGAGAILANRTTVQTLDRTNQWVFAVLAGLAVLANVIMLYQSDFAQFGSPRLLDALRPSDLANADLNPLVEAGRSVARLRRAVRAAFLSGVAASAALGVLLLASAAPAPPTSKVTFKTGGVSTTTACGTVAYTSPGSAPGTQRHANLLFTPGGPGAEAQTIPLIEVKTIAAC